MDKKYQYLDPAGTTEVIHTILEFSDSEVANMVTNIVNQSSGNKAPSAAVVKSLTDNIQEAINIVKSMVKDSQVEIDNTKQFVDDTKVDVNNRLNVINNKFDSKTVGVDFIQVYIVDCLYSEIINPENNTIYIYKDKKKNKFGLAYYNQGSWYVSGMIIPGLETLITENDVQMMSKGEISNLISLAYNKIK